MREDPTVTANLAAIEKVYKAMVDPMSLKDIDTYLQDFGFKKVAEKEVIDKDGIVVNIDFRKFDYILRIKQVHYLFYSHTHKMFTLAQKVDPHRPLGRIAKDYPVWIDFTYIDIPKVINDALDVEKVINGVCNPKQLHLYPF